MRRMVRYYYSDDALDELWRQTVVLSLLCKSTRPRVESDMRRLNLGFATKVTITMLLPSRNFTVQLTLHHTISNKASIRP